MLRRVRAFFDARGFFEVETPVLSSDTVVDRNLDPVPVTLFQDPHTPERGRRMWLQTSPELAMKRLLASGAAAIYQVAHAFRGGELGRLHNPEFTIVEWYRVGDGLGEGMQLLSDVAREVFDRGSAECVTYADAFEQHVGLDPHRSDIHQLMARAEQRHLSVPRAAANDDRDVWLDLLLVECIEPHLGRTRPTILHNYPASQAALARIRPGDPPIAERFELYVDGVELANGYHELLDADELRQRSRQANALRAADGKYALPEESRLLDAMDHGLPPCTGVALGFDRAVMLAAGAGEISQVMAFPLDRA
jgi:lysyl-tRNA synthetase class 2